MKKNISILIATFLLLTLFSSPALGEAAPAAEAPTGTPSNTLIVYFSRVGISDFDANVDAVASASLNLDENGDLIGNCSIAANYIHETIGGDMFQIITEQRYPSAYRDTTDLAAIELDDNARPVLSSTVENMAQYTTIFLVYPNWWGALPMAMNTFLESYDFSGKTLIPLCTHEGSGLGGTPREIAALCPDATLLSGLAIRGRNIGNAQDDVNNWLSQLGYIQ